MQFCLTMGSGFFGSTNLVLFCGIALFVTVLFFSTRGNFAPIVKMTRKLHPFKMTSQTQRQGEREDDRAIVTLWTVTKLVLLAVAVTLACFLCGCSSTVIPATVQAKAPSFDGGLQDSGFLGMVTNRGEVYGLLTSNAAARYSGLIQIYGNRFIPPLSIENNGLIKEQDAPNFLIDREHLIDFGQMSEWNRAGRK